MNDPYVRRVGKCKSNTPSLTYLRHIKRTLEATFRNFLQLCFMRRACKSKKEANIIFFIASALRKVTNKARLADLVVEIHIGYLSCQRNERKVLFL